MILKIGGPLAIRCDVCEQPPGAGCITAPHSLGTRYPLRKPHAARVKAAPPEMEVKAGDLVIVRTRDAEHVAVIDSIGAEVHFVRLWIVGAFYGLAVSRFQILRLAPEDERTAAARAALAHETA